MTVNRNRKVISREITYIGDFDGYTLVDLRKHIDELIRQYGDNAYINMQFVPYSESEDRKIYLYENSEETDEEMKVRIAQEEYWEKVAEERERNEFERLQKKFQK